MKQLERLAFSLALTNSRNGHTLNARVYLPRRRRVRSKEHLEPLVSWVATYSVSLNGLVQRRQAVGDDWLQALLLAVEGIRLRIDARDEQEWTTSEDIPFWMLFPRKVSISWGYEHFRKLRDHLEKEDAAVSNAATRRNARKRVETKPVGAAKSRSAT